MKDRRQLPALEKSRKVNKPDLPDISDKNYTDSILKYGGLATKFPQLNTNANTLVAAINELYARPIANNSHNILNGGGSMVIANPLVGDNYVLGTSEDQYIVTNLGQYIQVYQGEPAGLLYAVSIDGFIYDIENVSECDIDELQNVDISDARNGQVLQYNASTMSWQNVDASAFTPSLEGLTDVNIDNPQSGQALVYDVESSEWINGLVSTVGVLDDLTDVDIDNVTGGQVLKYDQTLEKWVNADDASGISRLDELTDVDITNPTTNQVLTYNGEEWVNETGAGTWEGTQAEYDLIEEKDPNIVYYITDAHAQTFNADAVMYNNTRSGLSATTVQSALDEIVETNVYWTDLTGTLMTGATSIQFHDDAIKRTSTVNVYVDSAFFGVSPISMSVINGYITLGFEEQTHDMPVKVRIS